MSNSQQPSGSVSSSKPTRSEASGLRALAPKIRPIAPRPPSSKTSTSSTHIESRGSSAKCAVCLKVDCQLLTHKTFGAASAQQNPSAQRNAVSNKGPGVGFTASYAFALAQQSVDRDGEDPSNPYYNLPVKPELNTGEMHRLFHDFFHVESHSTFRIIRPPEIAGDLILSPFFVPAMGDSALCLSILATAAAVIPTRRGMPARNVIALTLIGETMQQMRERIEAESHQISDATILAATFLWLANIWLEDVDAMRSHATSVVTFVTSRGGLNELGMMGSVAHFIRWIDVLHSVMTGQACLFLDELTLEPEMTSQVSQRYGSFWHDQYSTSTVLIDGIVVTSCRETGRLVDLLEAIDSDQKSPISPRQYVYVLQQLCSISIRDTILQAKLRGSTTLDECVLLAMLLIRIKTFCANLHLQHTLADRVAVALSDALQRMATGPTFWQTEIDLIIWLLFSFMLADFDFEGREWGFSLLCQAMTMKFGHPEKWVSSWQDDVRQLLTTFGWSQRTLAQETHTTCRLIANAHRLDSPTTEVDKGKAPMLDDWNVGMSE